MDNKKELDSQSIDIGDNIPVVFNKIMFEQGKRDGVPWRALRLEFKANDGRFFNKKLFEPNSPIARNEYAYILSEVLDTLTGEDTWNNIPRQHTWENFYTVYIQYLRNYYGTKVYLKTLPTKSYMDPKLVVADIPTRGFISKKASLSYSVIEESQAQDFYTPSVVAKAPKEVTPTVTKVVEDKMPVNESKADLW